MFIVTLCTCFAIFIGGYHINYLYNNPKYNFKRVKTYNKKLHFFGERNKNVLKTAIYMQNYAIISLIMYLLLVLINNFIEVFNLYYYPLVIFIIANIWLFSFVGKYNYYKYFKDKENFIKDTFDAISIDLELIFRKKVQIVSISNFTYDKKIRKNYCLCTVKIIKSKKIINDVACFIENVKIGDIYKMYHFRSKETIYHYVISEKI